MLIAVAVTALVALAMPSPAGAQSPETCVAYMEASAARDAAKEQADSALQATKGKLVEAIYSRRDAALAALGEEPRRAEGERLEVFRARHKVHFKAGMRIMRETRVALSKGGRDSPEYKAAVADHKSAIDASRQAFAEAVWQAYDGPTSDNSGVMAKLLNADIARCRAQGFQ